MKVLIDTNVLVSAALKNKTPEEVILFVASHADWEWIVSPDILAEYKAVLGRAKFGLPDDVLRKWHAFLDATTTLVEVDAALEFPRDQKDAKFLACALAAQADFFITGDHDFTEARKLVNTTILSASMFKRLVCDAIPPE
jgi:putative PIN family toxin of toxin-antitoxin system